MFDKLSFNLSNIVEQDFEFPPMLMNYLTENANAEIKQKLDRTCKHFYREAPYFIIDRFIVQRVPDGARDSWIVRLENDKYDGCIATMNQHEILKIHRMIRNIWVTKEIRYEKSDSEYMIGRITRCEVRKLIVPFADMTSEKFEFLSNSGNVKMLHCYSINDPRGMRVPLEDILTRVPKARHISIMKCHITDDTMSQLLAIPWEKKLRQLFLWSLNRSLDIDLYYEFVVNNIDSDGRIGVSFAFNNTHFKNAYNARTEGTVDLPEFRLLQVNSRLHYPPPASPDVTFHDDDIERQYFGLPYPVMCYIRENANVEVVKKLRETCKFFNEKNPYCIVTDIRVLSRHVIVLFDQNHRRTERNLDQIEEMNNFWITNSFHCQCDNERLFSKIVRCDAKYIKLSYCSISFNDFKVLTQSGIVQTWDSYRAHIVNADGSLSYLEDLLPHLSNANVVAARVESMARQISPTAIPQTINIKWLKVRTTNKPVNANQFYDVIKQVLAPKASMKLRCHDVVTEIYFTTFMAEMKTKLEAWRPRVKKPSIAFSFIVDGPQT